MVLDTQQEKLNQKYVAWLAAQRDASRNLTEAMENAVKSSLSYLKKNTDYRRIVLWSYLEGQEKSTDLDKRFTASLIESMRTGQAEGFIRDDVKAFTLPFIIRGAIDIWISKGELFEEMKIENEISDEDFIETLIKLVRK